MRDGDDKDKNGNGKSDVEEGSSGWLGGNNRFSDFDDDSDFEESDRDSDFNAIYAEEDEGNLDDDEWSDPDDEVLEISEEEDSSPWDDDSDEFQAEGAEQDLWDLDPNPQGSFDDDPPVEAAGALAPAAAAFTARDDTAEEWDEFEEDDYEEPEEETRDLNISMGMIVVVVVALILLGAGGYGIIEERASLQTEIRQLQAKLATSAPPEEVAASREATARANERSTRMQQQVAELGRENRSLQAIIGGLESQLASQQAALKQAGEIEPSATPAKPETTSKAPATAPARKADQPTVTPASPAPAAQPGSWFVNFSSYGQRATAQSWADKLKPNNGRVVVAEAQSNGRTIYRVRVIDLSDKQAADTVARQLQEAFKTGKLWVGRSG